MSIHAKILGLPFYDNALFVRIDSGHKQYRLLFDCGENTIQALPISEIQKIDHLFFSHFHLDHVAGFDHFIRMNYDRESKPVHIWGPESTIAMIFNRLNSFTWNLIKEVHSRWILHEITPQYIKVVELRSTEAFRKKHFKKKQPFAPFVLETDAFRVSVHLLNHGIYTLGFKVQEQQRLNIDKEGLKAMHLQAGPWILKVKDLTLSAKKRIKIGNDPFSLGELRRKLLRFSPGSCLSYLTDFSYSKQELQELTQWLDGCDFLFCESQYLEQDVSLAEQNYHLTAKKAALLARKARVKQLTLMHFSRRYKKMAIKAFITEAQQIFSPIIQPQEWMSEQD